MHTMFSWLTIGCRRAALAALLFAGGCACVQRDCPPGAMPGAGGPSAVAPVHPEMPKELAKIAMPPYRIEPPDLLVIDALRISPRPPYYLQTSDVIDVQVRGTLPDLPIAGAFTLGPGGVIDFGYPYGAVRVGGMSVDQARTAITEHLRAQLSEPIVSVTLLQMAASQQITGEHLVAQDGMVTLGIYGRVYVAGLTIEEAKAVIEQHLSQYLEAPQVAVDVFAYNSKVYYIITEGAGTGDRVSKYPITGNETVLDAIANVNGLTQISSKRIWIARPQPSGNHVQILPVDWVALSKFGVTATNYQVLPGDRVFIAEDTLVAFDTRLSKLLTPVERVFGFSTLGVSTFSRFTGNVLNTQNQGINNSGGGGF
jgi:polysaccharide export outer membrane protein